MVIEQAAAVIIQAQGFSKQYKKKMAVKTVDLTVRRSEIYGLIGPDGAGKSSLMKAIAGVLAFEQGRLQVFDVNKNIDFFAQLRLVTPEKLAERKQKLLQMTRLDKFRDRPMKKLSGGMKQKLGLICTLIHQPELLILDEPTTGVDPVSRRDFWAILTELLQEHGMTALISTAYMDEASRFHRLSLMHEGQILATGEPDTVQQQAAGSIVELNAELSSNTLRKIKKRFSQVDVMGNMIRIFVDNQSLDNAVEVVADSLSDCNIQSIQAINPNLEDAFIALLRHKKLIIKAEQDTIEINTNRQVQVTSEIAIEARNLTRDFGAFRAVDQINFTVRQGEIFGLLGANGAGKTTAIKMLTGILSPSAGEGEVAGINMRFAGQAIKERIGYMSQAFSLYQDLTVLENLQLYASIYGVQRQRLKQRIDELIVLAGLQSVRGSLVQGLPMGMRQRLALSCALVHQPCVLFLDEPTSGVDPIGRRRFWDILVHLAKVDNVAILVTTHYMNEAEHCDHLALMYAGRVVADDSPKKMKYALAQESGQLLEVLVNRPQLAMKVLQQANFEGASLFGKHIHLLTQDIESSIQQLKQLFNQYSIELIRYRPLPITLEDVFVYRVLALEKQAQS